MFLQPLEQFEITIFSVLSLKLHSLVLFFINNFLLFLLLVVVALYYFLLQPVETVKIVPCGFQYTGESLYKFIYDIVRQQIGERGAIFYPVLFSIFLFILITNLNGLLPFSFTPTSHIVNTFTISLSCFIAITLYGFYFQKLHFLELFVPKGVPAPLVPVLVVIELISYIARAFSLAIRLFANMMAGHTLLNILAGFSVVMFTSSVTVLYFAGFVPLLLVLLILGLEIGISMLQAYVFTVLLAIYFSEAFEVGH